MYEKYSYDEYHSAAEVTNDDCHSIYKDSCPMSILEILLRGDFNQLLNIKNMFMK